MRPRRLSENFFETMLLLLVGDGEAEGIATVFVVGETFDEQVELLVEDGLRDAIAGKDSGIGKEAGITQLEDTAALQVAKKEVGSDIEVVGAFVSHRRIDKMVGLNSLIEASVDVVDNQRQGLYPDHIAGAEIVKQ